VSEQAEPIQILIVEDNPTNLLLVDAVLRLHGFRTASARSAEEMYARLEASRPDMILMDVQLPGQDGLSLTRALKADPTTSAIPIVALTAHAMPEDRARALAAGCIGYIAKPFNTRTLPAELLALLDRSRGTGPPECENPPMRDTG
jgi:CheY-like chemotaxis protein